MVAISKCPFSLRNKVDSYIWAPETSRHFTVKSAYHLAMSLHSSSLVGAGQIWREIWHCKTLPKINHFLWHCCRDILPLGSTHLHRRFTDDAICPRCGVEEETILHFFFKCPHSLQTWKRTPLRLDFSNLKARNRLVFEGALWHPSFVASKAVQSFWEFFDVQKCCLNVHLTLKPSVSPLSWSPPPFGKIKCNVDASFFHSTGLGGGGAIFRTSDGLVLKAVVFKQFSASSPLVADALAFRLAVMWARVFDFQHVWFESDAQTLVEALHVKVSHVRRQGNRAAHALASLSSSCLCADSVISHFPAEAISSSWASPPDPTPGTDKIWAPIVLLTPPPFLKKDLNRRCCKREIHGRYHPITP
ncbi:uncharacterized protein LOC132281824 [Cornus florida]|uniref:uncharacterized protein LOC132281824 n=1 Tax=Cornus florida TaxID=4283 RepID=UPI00289CDE42|nr:uncharacterized protein LOC132281824 [Cornus florida]